MVQMVGYDYMVDVTNRAVYRKNGRPIKMMVNNWGSRYMLTRQDGKRKCISANRVIYAAMIGISPDTIPKDIYIIPDGDGYKLMYHKDMNAMNHEKARNSHIRNYRNMLIRRMLEMNILLNYYDTGNSLPLVEYIMEKHDELEEYIYKKFGCSKQTAHDVVSETIEDICQRADSHNLYMSSITSNLKDIACGKIRQRRKAVYMAMPDRIKRRNYDEV